MVFRGRRIPYDLYIEPILMLLGLGLDTVRRLDRMAFFPLDTFASSAYNLSGTFESQEFIQQDLYLFHFQNLFILVCECTFSCVM